MTRNNKAHLSFRKPLSYAVILGSLALGAASAVAGPENAQVVHGAASINQAGNVTNITTSHQAIINYSKFNIGPSETVNFIQPGARSRVLNRINGVSPTVIEGRLNANGSVYFVNPQGVRFANGAVVNVGSIFAAAGSMSNQDFLAGHDRFTALTGAVVNEGLINGREVGLVGQQVINRGQINLADDGLLAMAAGDQVIIARHGSHISVEVNNDNPSTGSVFGAGDLGALAMAVPAGGSADVQQSGAVAVAAGPSGSDVVVAGGDVLIDSAVSGAKNYTVNATSSITFDVAATPAVESSQVQTYNVVGSGPINLMQDTTLNGTAVRFNGNVNSTKAGTPATLTINGAADFNGSVGATTPLQSIDVSGTTNIAGGTVATAMDQDYRGIVNLVNDATLTSGTEVHFHKSVADASASTKGVGVGADLVVTAPDVYFDSRVSADTVAAGRIVGSLLVNGRTIINNRGQFAVLRPNRFTTVRDQVFNGPVVLTEDAFVKSFTGDVRFLDTLDASPSAFAAGNGIELPTGNGAVATAGLTVLAMQGDVQFAKDVGLNGFGQGGANVPLDFLVAVAAPQMGKMISFGSANDGSNPLPPSGTPVSVTTTGDILLNPSQSDLVERGRTIIDGEFTSLPFIPLIATVEGRDGTVSLESLAGAIYTGQNNKVTVLGDLNLMAADIVKVGDLNALNNMKVHAGNGIVLRTRAGSNLYDFQGNLVGPASTDVNLDVVSNGTYDFNLTPTLENGGNPIFAGTPQGAAADVNNTLGGFVFITQSRGANEHFLAAAAGQVPAGQTLDLTPFQGPPPPPLNEDAFILAGPLPFQDRVIREPLLAPADQQFMATAMVTQSRTLLSGEYATGLNRIRVYNDGSGPLAANVNTPGSIIALNRVRRGSAEEAIATMQAIAFGTPGATASAVDRRQQVRTTLTNAWAEYQQADPQTGFMQYLATTEAQRDSYHQVQQVADLLTRMKKTGITRFEYAVFANNTLAPLTPDNMTVEQLHELLTGEPIVNRGTAMRTATNAR